MVSLLDQDDIHRIHSAAIAAGLHGSRWELLSGLPKGFVAALPLADSPSVQILSDLQILNAATLANGVDGLCVWLNAAASITTDTAQHATFMRALARRSRASEYPGPPSERVYLRSRCDVLESEIQLMKHEGSDEHAIAKKLEELERANAERLSLWTFKNGTLIGKRFRLEKRIGLGRVAEVWSALDLKTRRQGGAGGLVALSFLRPALQDNERSYERFVRGAEFLRELQGHENIVQYLGTFLPENPESGGYLFYSSRYCRDGDLQAAVERGDLDLGARLALIRDVGAALKALHQINVFHRDVSPSNVLLDRSARGSTLRAVLGDFDSVLRAGDYRLTLARSHLGTWSYIAPEVVTEADRDDDPGPREGLDVHKAIARDIYALSATALFVVTGVRPPPELYENAPIWSAVPPSLQPALRKGCAPRWQDRFGSVEEFLVALRLEPPRDTLNNIMGQMRSLQGKRCAPDDSLPALARAQIEACAMVFSHADEQRIRDLLEHELGSLGEVPKDAGRLEASVAAFLRSMLRFRTRSAAECRRVLTGGERRLDAMVEAVGELVALSEGVPYDSLDPDEILFLEYLLGLGYFEVFSYFGAVFVDLDEMARSAYAASRGAIGGRCQGISEFKASQQSYVQGLDDAFVRHDASMAYLRTWYRGQNRGSLWENILSAWDTLAEGHGGALARQIERAVSLRGLPEGRAQIITLAQVMHWVGWGGSGSLFERVQVYCRSRLAQVFKAHQHQAFDWHGLSNDVLNVNFSHRKNFFAAAFEKLADYSAGAVAVLLSHPALAVDARVTGDDMRLIRIWGDAVGPKRISERRIMENAMLCTQYMRLDRRVRFELTASDISAPSLEILSGERALLDGSREVEQRELVWRDLNIGFPGEPGCPPTERTPAVSSYDCYSCAISLHQIADRRRVRHDRIRAIMAFATRIVRPGGVIAAPDVGRGIALQVFLLPTNLVDREGGWGGDVFSVRETVSGERIHRFGDVASTLDGSYLTEMSADARRRVEETDDVVKIPLPLLGLHRGTPRALAAVQRSIYEMVPYLVVAIPWSVVARVDEVWCERVAAGTAKSLVDEALDHWRPEVASAAVAGAARVVGQLGFALASRPPPGRPQGRGEDIGD